MRRKLIDLMGQRSTLVERAEAALAALGFRDFRVRYLDGRAKLQVTAAQMGLALEKRRELLQALQPEYTEVLLDLEERACTIKKQN